MRKHDVVETSKMSAEYNGALIDVTRSTATDLDNGRLVVRDGDGYKYPTDATATELFLVTTPEKTYENVGLGDFFNKAGKKIRVFKVMPEDEFGTTAFDGEVAKGDILMVNAEGKLVANVAGAIEFEVLAKRLVSGYSGIVVKRVK